MAERSAPERKNQPAGVRSVELRQRRLEDPVWVYAVIQAEAEGVRWARLEERAQTNRLTEAEAALTALRYRGWVLALVADVEGVDG